MIKRTVYFGNPAYLNLSDDQLIVKLPEIVKNDTIPENFKKEAIATIPIEDLGIIVLDHPRITITQGLIEKLLENNVAIITCDKHHLPTGLLLPLCGNTLQSERFKDQISASEPLKKNIWQQTIEAKIRNQANVLKKHGYSSDNMNYWSDSVKSGDTGNHEARAAAYYWGNIFQKTHPSFTRDRDGDPPNNLLNYGYSILRGVVARSLVASGLLPTLGVHHHNKYNAYCLADDIMEPYRPYVDEVVLKIMKSIVDYKELTKEIKAELLTIPVLDVMIDGNKSPLMIGVQKTTTSLVRCFNGEIRKVLYPVLED
jgi:CRISPR-associated protein Cas1